MSELEKLLDEYERSANSAEYQSEAVRVRKAIIALYMRQDALLARYRPVYSARRITGGPLGGPVSSVAIESES